MKRKFFCGLAFVLSLLLVLSACGGTDTPAETGTTEETVSGTVLFAADSEDNYKIVRGDSASEGEVHAAVQLRSKLKEIMTGMSEVLIETDFSMDNKKNQTVEVPGKEILVGQTNRRESRELMETLKSNEYVIKTVGEKLVILGGNEYSTQEAMNVFIETYLPLATADRFVLEEAIDIKAEVSKEGPPLEDDASYRLLSWNLGCSVGVYNDVITVLAKYLPEIIALQECNPKMFTNGIDIFIHQHPEYKYAKQYHDNSNTRLYTPIIYNSEVVTLVRAGCEWLRSRYTGTNTKSIGWAIFEVEGQKFAVINFHGAVVSGNYDEYKDMPSDQRTALAKQWRVDNAKQLVELKEKICRLEGDIPITINGDCNFNSSSEPFGILTSAGFKDSEQTADRKIRYGYSTAYTYSNGLPGKGSSIDHIFGINGIHFFAFDTVREDPVVTASDHTPIYADIGFDLP